MSKQFRLVYFILILVFFSIEAKAQYQKHDTLAVMFYNVENYFDTINNTLAQDDFTPDDIYEWTHERFVKKRDAIAEVIMAINSYQNSDSSARFDSVSKSNPPHLIGLCEVENRFVLQQLLDSTSLKHYGYSILHRNSPDVRGIDVALLYRSNYFRLLDSAFFLMSSDTLNTQSREILYAKGIVNERDTLHVFVNHFPSKRGGVKKTAHLRMAAAQTLRQHIDSILISHPAANILAMGDFNDTYKSKTLTDGLCATSNFASINNASLYNLSASAAKAGEGSVKYSNRWQLVDMFLVSGNLLNNTSLIRCTLNDVRIFAPNFLLEYVETGNTYRPKPTYRWINYVGGYSDHLPVIAKFKIDD